MTPTSITPVRLNALDKAALVELAARLGRSQSGVIRALVRETLAILREQDDKSATLHKESAKNLQDGDRQHDRSQ